MVSGRRSEACPSTPGRSVPLPVPPSPRAALPANGAASCSAASRCAVPDVVLETPLLDFKRCFLNQPCEKKVRFTNAGDVPACYSVLEQVRKTKSCWFLSGGPGKGGAWVLALTSDPQPEKV